MRGTAAVAVSGVVASLSLAVALTVMVASFRDSVTRWLPQPGPARVAAAAVFTSVAGAMTLMLVWLATQGDAAIFMTGLLGDRLRAAVLAGARDLAIGLLGEAAFAALQATGAIGASLLVVGFVLTAFGTVAGIRRLAVAGRRVG